MPVVLTDKKMRPRDKHDNYPTPKGLVRAILNHVSYLYEPGVQEYKILDPGAGSGVWGEVAREIWPDAYIRGIDIREFDALKNHEQTKNYLSWYDAYYDGQDYLTFFDEDNKFDLIVGNPPYKYAEDFVRKSQKLLKPSGLMVFLLRLDFLASMKRGRGLFWEYSPVSVHVCSRRPSFTGDKKTYADNYAVFFWGKQSSSLITKLYWLDWDYEK